MRYTLSLLTYLLLLSLWGHPCEAQQAVLGRVTSIDSAHARISIETNSTLFGDGGEELVLDLSQLDGEHWDNLQPGDNIRAWTAASTSRSDTPIARSMQSWSQRPGNSADPTGVRQRLSRESFGGTSRSMGSGAGMGGGRSASPRSSSGGRR